MARSKSFRFLCGILAATMMATATSVTSFADDDVTGVSGADTTAAEAGAGDVANSDGDTAAVSKIEEEKTEVITATRKEILEMDSVGFTGVYYAKQASETTIGGTIFHLLQAVNRSDAVTVGAASTNAQMVSFTDSNGVDWMFGKWLAMGGASTNPGGVDGVKVPYIDHNGEAQQVVTTQTPGRMIKFEAKAGDSLRIIGAGKVNLRLASKAHLADETIGEAIALPDANVTEINFGAEYFTYDGTYYLTNSGAFTYYYLELTTSAPLVERRAWSQVPAPSVTIRGLEGATSVRNMGPDIYDKDGSDRAKLKLAVDYTCPIGYDGADTVYATLHELNDGKIGGIIETVKAAEYNSTSGTLLFDPPKTSNYTIRIYATREGEFDKATFTGNDYHKPFYVQLTLGKASIASIIVRGEDAETSVGWLPVPQAEKYVLQYASVGGTDWKTLFDSEVETVRKYTIPAGVLQFGATYDFRVVAYSAVTKGDQSFSDTVTKKIEVTPRLWKFGEIGQGYWLTQSSETRTDYEDAATKGEKATHTGMIKIDYKDGNGPQVVVGKEGALESASEQFPQYGETTKQPDEIKSIRLRPNSLTKLNDSEDGISYFYTEVDPENENWTFTATFTATTTHINASNYANTLADNQTGFGIMAIDTVIQGNGDARYFNSAAAAFCRTWYSRADGTETQLQGVPSGRFKSGFVHTSALRMTEGVGRYFTRDSGVFDSTWNDNPGHTSSTTSTRWNLNRGYTFRLRKSNDGFHASFLNPNGTLERSEIIAYDPDMLLQQDPDRYYVGVFAARRCDVTVTDMSFTTKHPSGDPARAEVPRMETGTYLKHDSTTATVEPSHIAYFYSNIDGYLEIQNKEGGVVIPARLMRNNTRTGVSLNLKSGKNALRAVLTPLPEEDQTGINPKNETYTNYDPIYTNFTVEYQAPSTAPSVFVTPDGTVTAQGTRQDPLDLATAIRFAKPGQQIVLLPSPRKAETGYDYSITSKLNIPRGNDNGILMGEPGQEIIIDITRSRNGGIEVAGNGWHVYNLTFTRQDFYDGLDNKVQMIGGRAVDISGHRNRIERITVHSTWDTGIQISGNTTEPASMWPSDNLIISCVSYNNTDPTKNDADGFAAKLTSGDNNRFRYCIAFNNIDDGWDLYAKSIHGPIGHVTIEDCVTFNNGNLILRPHENAEDVVPGEGNGFKMGGESIPGDHTLRNSISFNNVARGVTSNSGPDIQIYNTISAYNGEQGYHLYTSADISAFKAQGTISHGNGLLDTFQLVNQQNASLTDDSHKNFFWTSRSQQASGTLGNATVSDSWFKKTNVLAAVPKATADGKIDVSALPRIAADGSVDLQGFFEVVDTAPASVKAASIRPFTAGDPDYKTVKVIEGEGSKPGGGGGSGGGGGYGGGNTGGSTGGSTATKTETKTESSDKATETTVAGAKATTITEKSAVAAVTKALASVEKAAKAADKDPAKQTVTVKVKNVAVVAADTFKAMVKAVGNRAANLKLVVDSLSKDGKVVEVRLTIEPSKVKSNTNLSGSTTNATATKTKAKFNKFYSNKLSVVNLGQSGKLDTSVKIAAKADKSLKAKSLVVYSFDTKTNKFKQIKDANPKLDKNGYVHFTTNVGGTIIISESKLARK